MHLMTTPAAPAAKSKNVTVRFETSDVRSWSWPAWVIGVLASFDADAVPVLIADDEPETTPIPYERMTVVVAERRR